MLKNIRAGRFSPMADAALRLSVIVAVYFGLACLGKSLAFSKDEVAAIRLQAGFGLAMLILWGARWWPGIFLGSLISCLHVGLAWESTMAIATGNSLGIALVSAGVRRIAGGKEVLQRGRTILVYALLAAMGAALCAGFWVLSAALAGRLNGGLASSFLTLWLANLASMALVVPVILTWFNRPHPPWHGSQWWEGVGVLALLAGCGQFILCGSDVEVLEQSEWLVLLPLLWAAFRFGAHGLTIAVAAIFALAYWGVIHGHGPFILKNEASALLLMQSFVGTISLLALGLLPFVTDLKAFKQAFETSETERKGTENALRQSEAELRRINATLEACVAERSQALVNTEARYQSLFAAVLDAVFVLDPENQRFLAVNDAALQMYGYTREEMLRMGPMQISAEPEATRETIARVMAGMEGRGILRRHRKKDGTVFPVEISHGAFDYENQKFYCAIIRDITDNQRKEDSLRESNEKFHRLFETVADAVYVMDGKTLKILDANEAAQRMYGYTREQLLGRNALDMTAELEATRQSLSRALAGAADPSPRRLHRKKDGTVFPVEISASTFEVRGRVFICGVVRDKTGQAKAENALRSSEERYRSLAESLPDAVVILDRHSVYKYLNSTAAQWMRRPAAELIGRNRAEFFPPGIVSQKQAMLDWVVANRQMAVDEWSVPFQDGEKWVETRMVPLGSESGSPELVLAISRDLTEQRLLQEEVLRISAEERQRIGYDLHDGLGQHLSGIAFLGKALEKDLEQASPAHADELGRIVKLINQAIAQTRTMARLLAPVDVETNGLQLALTKLADDARDLFRVQVAGAGDPAEFQVEVETGTLLYRIAQEAIHNAIKHGGASRIDYALRLRDGEIQLTVRDNGKGFSTPETQSPSSSGMGLRIMNHRAKAAGGDVSVTSEPGKGATVICTIPVEAVAGAWRSRRRFFADTKIAFTKLPTLSDKAVDLNHS